MLASSTEQTVKPKAKGGRARARLLKALRAAIAEAKEVAKGGRNALHSYNYARAEDMIGEAKAILAKHGLAVLSLGRHIRRDEAGGRVLATEWVLFHDEHGEVALGEHEWPIVEEGRDVGKAFAAADTSSLAYFLRNLLQLPRVEQGGQIDDEKHADNMPTEAALRGAIAAEFDRLGVPVEERDTEATRLNGAAPVSWADLLRLLTALRSKGTPEVVAP